MLVLSRQHDETIMIGDDIEVTVVDIRGDKVRLGITAPKEISVHRKEIYDAIQRENRAAAQVKPEDLSGLGRRVPASVNGVAVERPTPEEREDYAARAPGRELVGVVDLPAQPEGRRKKQRGGRLPRPRINDGYVPGSGCRR